MTTRTQEGGLSLREEQAQLTRRRIADAAETLFGEGGYGATTIVAIAAQAGVAVQTVYAVYGSKAGILAALRERIVHDSQADSLFSAALSEPRAERRLALFAQSIRTRWQNGATILTIHRDAALTDPAVRDGVEQALLRRRAGLRRLATKLEPNLGDGLDLARASAILDALTLPELWSELVGVHGWSPDGYERWLQRTLVQQLLAGGVVTAVTRRP